MQKPSDNIITVSYTHLDVYKRQRLTNMIKSGQELKVFSIPQKDLKKFTEQAKRYGVLYCVLRDKNTEGENAPVDIIARAEDASKIQVQKGEIIEEEDKTYLPEMVLGPPRKGIKLTYCTDTRPPSVSIFFRRKSSRKITGTCLMWSMCG